MARTVTTLINAATVGATASEASNITELTLAAGTAAVGLEITFTPGAARETGSIRVFWAGCITNLSADAASVRKLLRGSTFFELPKNLEPGVAHTFTTALLPIRGDYVNVWVSEPVLAATGTLTVKSVELDPVGVGTAGSPSTSVTTIQGLAYSIRKAFSRPENTTAYTALDVIGIADAGTPANAGSAIHELTSIGPSGGHILITDVCLEIDLAAVTASMSTFRLHLYDASPAAILDNAAFNLGGTAADRAKYLGAIEIVIPIDRGATLWSENVAVNKKVKLATGSTSLFAVLQTDGGYTPTSAEAFAIRVEALAV